MDFMNALSSEASESPSTPGSVPNDLWIFFKTSSSDDVPSFVLVYIEISWSIEMRWLPDATNFVFDSSSDSRIKPDLVDVTILYNPPFPDTDAISDNFILKDFLKDF